VDRLAAILLNAGYKIEMELDGEMYHVTVSHPNNGKETQMIDLHPPVGCHYPDYKPISYILERIINGLV